MVARLKRKLLHLLEQRKQRILLSPLYDPDIGNVDVRSHLHEAMNWLKRAQDVGSDRGVSYGVFFGQDFDLSYPETTGYICQTFVEQAQLTSNSDLLNRAIAMGDWEIDILLPEGAVMGGRVNTQPSPAIFNTGMVLLGWSALIQLTDEERFKQAAWRASEWLVAMQETNGSWICGNSKFSNPESTLYNVKAAWGLCAAGLALGEERFIQAALRNAGYCLKRQMSNGWFPDCCLTDRRAPLLHTLAYAMQGLVGIGKVTGREDLIDGARRLADSLLKIMHHDGFIAGRLRSDLSPAVKWCCLTGSAQTSIIWSELFLITCQEKYREAALRVNRYLMTRHDIRNPDFRLRGGLSGSYPVWGEYGRLSILNWATKFLVDALALELRISA
ncbi:prenyltransferase/squalene oxidase repeat-containing protein [Bythopirellula goksoeyrii]|uniref:Squalene cyclase C-terminal domain-containing protein n=1 Tax=Bythopirellula goksoeyrii TaxID=1400387 RepID=A0A5B9QDZ4_9BACT|nr:hypothetical protein [Bythopirellula goksoeyrii]QEG36029.1 hypothetical protein Pr1d_33380 [Bythopirellula goksoeyrii]